MTADASPVSRRLHASTTRGRWWPGVLLVAALVAAFLFVAAIGAGQAARDERVLPFLDPVVAFVRTWGLQSLRWLLAHATTVGWTVTGTATVITVSGFAAAGLRAAPIVLLALGASFATWGQVFLLADRTKLGAWLYGLAALCTLILSIRYPIQRLSGFPPPPSPPRRPHEENAEEPPAHATRQLPSPKTGALWWEYALVFLLTLAALLTRTYALTEFPQGFDLETVDYMIMSRTLHGIRQYLQYVFWANNNGIFHILTQRLLFPLFGTSIYTVRLTAAFWGAAAVPLMYWLVRRMAGVVPAIVSTLFVMVGPEQLFWSRTENNFFAVVAVLALVTAHVGLWMLERLSFKAVLTAALWMPISRYVYTPSMIMFLYPVTLFAHAVVFVRGAWRKAWYVVPLLAGGVVLWVFSLSFLTAYGNNWQWRFIHPANVHGGAVWPYYGAFRGASLLDLVRLQAEVIASNLGHVITGIAYDGTGMFSHWYVRGSASPDHITVMNIGLAVILALGLGYLLGQVYDQRAFALLVWVVLGLLPGVMSDEPSPRRTAVIFPAVYAIAGVMVIAAVRVVRARAGPRVARMAAVALGVAVVGVVWTSLVCHFLIGTGPVVLGDHIRFAKPVFEGSDVIVHNLEMGGLERALVLGNLDSFLERTPCYQHVEASDWHGAALRPRCDFTETVYPLVMSPERIAALRQAYNPRRITFLMEETPYSRPHVDLLYRLYPRAKIGRHQSAIDQKRLVAITVDRSDVDALHSPSLTVTPNHGDGVGLATTLLAGVTLKETPPADADAAGRPGIVVQGGLLLDRPAWYQFQVEPECSAATLMLDHRMWSSAEAQPMLAGVHLFEITLPSSTACTLPLQLRMRSHEDQAMVSVDPTRYVSLSVASLPELQAWPAIAYPGYGEVKTFIQLSQAGMDLGIDAEGHISVLASDRNPMVMRRFTPEGIEEASWQVELPIRGHLASIVVDPDGAATLLSETAVVRYDRAGNTISAWQTPWQEWSSEIVRWRDGRVILAVPDRDAIAIFTPEGQLQREMKRFNGGPEFHKPVSLTLSPEGELLVIQDDGGALLFHNSGEEFEPEFERAFHVDFGQLPLWSHGCAFDGPDRILIPDMSTNTSLVYSREGQRMMAATPERDLGSKALGGVLRFYAAPDRLYALDRAGRVFSAAR